MVHFCHFLVYTLTGKPNSVHDSADGEEDGEYCYISLSFKLFVVVDLLKDSCFEIVSSIKKSGPSCSNFNQFSAIPWLIYS